MYRKLLILTAVFSLLAPACSGNIYEAVRAGTFEAAYYYHSGAAHADRFVTITVVVSGNGGALKREERSVGDSSRNRETLARFSVTAADLKKLSMILEQHGFFDLKTIKNDDPDARTVYLKIKSGKTPFIREESPSVSMATGSDRRRFMALIGEFNAFVKERLPAGKKQLTDY